MSRTRQIFLFDQKGRRLADVAGGSWDFKHGYIIKRHSHPEDQLLFAAEGVMAIDTDQGIWVVPPLRAVWIALGSGKSALVRLVLRQAASPVLLGAGIGLTAALVALRWVGSLLYQTPVMDPLAIGGSVVLLLAAAAVGSAHPLPPRSFHRSYARTKDGVGNPSTFA